MHTVHTQMLGFHDLSGNSDIMLFFTVQTVKKQKKTTTKNLGLLSLWGHFRKYLNYAHTQIYFPRNF